MAVLPNFDRWIKNQRETAERVNAGMKQELDSIAAEYSAYELECNKTQEEKLEELREEIEQLREENSRLLREAAEKPTEVTTVTVVTPQVDTSEKSQDESEMYTVTKVTESKVPAEDLGPLGKQLKAAAENSDTVKTKPNRRR